MVDRKKYPNGFYFDVPGHGKDFAAKRALINL